MHVCLYQYDSQTQFFHLTGITDVKNLTGSFLLLLVCVCVLWVCMSICEFNENHIRWSLILSPEPWRGGRCFRSSGPWAVIQPDGPTISLASCGRWGLGRCCQNSSDITRASPLIFTAISDCGRLCFQSGRTHIQSRSRWWRRSRGIFKGTVFAKGDILKNVNVASDVFWRCHNDDVCRGFCHYTTL